MLYQLQTTLSAIDEERALRGELPLEVQDLEDEIAGLTTRVVKIKMTSKSLRMLLSRKRLKLTKRRQVSKGIKLSLTM